MRTGKLCWVLVLFLFAVGCSADLPHEAPFDPDSPAARQQKGAVTGQVRLENETDWAQVSLRLKNALATYETQSAGDGTYSFDHVIPGVYTLSASARYFAEQTVEVTVALGESVKVPVFLLSAARTTVSGSAKSERLQGKALIIEGAVAIKLARAASLRGASAAPHRPLAETGGADGSEPVQFSTMSGGQGQWSLTGVPTGVYVLTASKSGVPDQTVSGIRVEGEGAVAVSDVLLRPLTGFFTIVGRAGGLPSPLYTTEATVALQLSGFNANRMKIADGDLSGACPYGEAIAYNANHTWTLPAEGVRTVCVRFVSAEGEETEDLFGTITYDKTPPALLQTAFLDSNGFTKGAQAVLQTAAADAGSGLRYLQVAPSEEELSGSLLPWASTTLVPFAVTTGTQTRWVRVVDNAGNVSAALTASTNLDADAPLITRFEVTDGDGVPRTRTNTTGVQLALAAADPDGNALEMLVSNRADFAGAAWQPYQGSFAWSVPPSSVAAGESRTVYVRVRDVAGREAAGGASASFTLDMVGPTATSAAFATPLTNQAAARLLLSASDAAFAEVDGALSFATAVTTAESTLLVSLSGLDGEKTVYVRFVDDAGNRSNPIAATVVLDREAPVNPVFSVTTPAPSNAATVAFALSAVGASHYRLAEGASCAAAGWAAYQTTASLGVSPGDGLKTFVAQFRDLAGNETACLPASIVIDRTKPAVQSTPVVGDGSGVTRNALVTVQMDVTGADQVRISENLGFTGASWMPAAAATTFLLSPGDGLKTLYFLWRDAAGNETGPTSATITLDATGPENLQVTHAGGTSVTTSTVTLLVTATGAPVKMLVSNDLSFSGASEVDFSPSITHTLSAGDGFKMVWVKARDAAGNWSAPSGLNLFLDTQAPSDGALLINGGAPLAANPTVMLSLGAAGADQVEVSGDIVGGTTGWLTHRNALSVALSAGEGVKILSARWRDTAGNYASPVTAAIRLDLTPPVDGSVSIGASEITPTPTVTLALTFDGATEMMIANDQNFSGGAWEPVTPAKTWSLSPGDGLKSVYVKFRDAAGNQSQRVSDTITLDTTPPVNASFAIVEGPETASATVTLNLTATGAAEVMSANDAAFSDGAWVPFAPSIAHTVAAGDGLKVVYVKFRDSALNETTVLSQVFTLDTGAPAGPQVLIDGGASHTRSAAVTLYLSAAEAVEMALSNDGFAFSAWEPFAPVIGYSLPGTDGTKRVWVKFRDNAGNETAIVDDGIVLDRIAPSGGSVLIEAGQAYTQRSQVVLAIGAVGASEMQVSEDNSFNGINWEAYAETRLFTVGSGDGSKTVYVRFRDEAGHVTGFVSDSITLDQSPPVLQSPPVSLNAGATFTNTPTVAVTLRYVDAVSAVLAEDIGFAFPLASISLPGGGVYAGAVSLASGDGTKNLYVKFADAAGNTNVQVASIVLDTVTPQAPSVSIDAGAAFNTSPAGAATLTLGGTDSLAGLAQVRISNTNANGDLDGAPLLPFAPQTNWVLAAPGAGVEGARTVYVQLVDAAGNRSAIASDSITYDTLPPTGGSVLIDAGALYARSTSVLLAIAGTNAAEMMVANDSGFAGRNFEPFSSSRSWVLASGGDGLTQTVYVKLKDAAGNVSGTFSDAITVDTVAPSLPSIALDGGAEYPMPSPAYTRDEEIEVSLNGTGWSEVELSEDVSFLGPVAVFDNQAAMPVRISFSPGNRDDGLKTVYARFFDAAGNQSSVVSASITLDQTEPRFPSFTINGGSAVTDDPMLSMDINAYEQGSGHDLVEFALNSSFTINRTVQPFASTVPYDLGPAPDGAHPVYMRVYDKAGNVSTTAVRTVGLDTTPPTADAIVINRGNSITSSNVLELLLQASDATKMMMQLSENASFAGASWVDYQTQVSFPASIVNGGKTVYFRVRDAVGQTSASINAAIVLDTLPPSSVTASFPWPATNTVTAPLTVSYFENLGPQVYVKVSGVGLSQVNGAALNVNKFIPITEPITVRFTSGNRKDVLITLRDSAGNEAPPVTASLVIDTTPPSSPPVLQAAQGANKRATLSWTTVAGASYYVVEYMKDYIGGTFTATGNLTSTSTNTTVEGLENGYNYGFRVRAYDSVGNPSALYSNILKATVGVTGVSIDQSGELNAIKAITMDGNTIHLVTGNSSGQIEYRRSYDNGKTWSRKILAGQFYDGFDAKVQAVAGRVLIAYKKYGTMNLLYSADGGESFTGYTVAGFSSPGQYNGVPEEWGLAIDGANVLLGGSNASGQYVISRSRLFGSAAFSWSAPTVAGTGRTEYLRSDVCISGRSALHVFIDTNGYLQGRYSKDAGHSWAAIDIDRYTSNKFDHVSCRIDRDGTAYVLYQENSASGYNNLVLAVSADLKRFARSVLPNVIPGITPSFTNPHLWLNDANGIFVTTYEASEKTLWLIQSLDRGMTWRMVQLDSNTSAGLRNLITGTGLSDYRVVYDVDDKQSVRFITSALPAPARFEAKSTYDVNLESTRWTTVPGVNDYAIYTAGSPDPTYWSGDSLSFTSSYWAGTYWVSSRDSYGEGGKSSEFTSRRGQPFSDPLDELYWYGTLNDADMTEHADLHYTAIAVGTQVYYQTTWDDLTANNWTLAAAPGSPVYCVDIEVDSNYVYLLYGTATRLYFQRFDGSSWSAAQALVTPSTWMSGPGCAMDTNKNGQIRVVGFSGSDIYVVKSNNSGASFGTGAYLAHQLGSSSHIDIAVDESDINKQIIAWVDSDMSNWISTLKTTNDWTGYVEGSFDGEKDVKVETYDGVAYAISTDGFWGNTRFAMSGMSETNWTFGTMDPSGGRIGGITVSDQVITVGYSAYNSALRVASCSRNCTTPSGWAIASVKSLKSGYKDIPLFTGTYTPNPAPSSKFYSYGVLTDGSDERPFQRYFEQMWEKQPVLTPTTGGLIAQFYSGTNFQQYHGSSIVSSLNQSWGTAAPLAGMGSDNWSVVMSGWLWIPMDGQYRFYTSNDDGVRIVFDGSLLTNAWFAAGATGRYSALSSNLKQGWYPISLFYMDSSGSAAITVYLQRYSGGTYGSLQTVASSGLGR